MPKMIRVRNVPDRLHKELVRRARAKGQTLTDYIQAILQVIRLVIDAALLTADRALAKAVEAHTEVPLLTSG